MPPSVPHSPPASVSPSTNGTRTASYKDEPPVNSGTGTYHSTSTTLHEAQNGESYNGQIHGNSNTSSNPLQNNNTALTSYGGDGMYGTGSSLYGTGYNGMYGTGYNSMYGGGGMYGGMYGGMSPYYGGMMTPGPLSGLNQFLFSVQSVIFSLGQAVQIIGMNTQGLRQLMESATAMFDHAVETWHEMQSLEQMARHNETEEDRKRRARLRAMRMALVAGISYLGYRLVRRLLSPRRHRPAVANTGYTTHNSGYGNYASSMTPYSSRPSYY